MADLRSQIFEISEECLSIKCRPLVGGSMNGQYRNVPDDCRVNTSLRIEHCLLSINSGGVI